MKKKLYREVKLKDGTILPKGMTVTVTPGHVDNGEYVSMFANVVTPEGRELKLRYSSVFEPPSVRQLEKWEWDGYCMTPSGKKVEPDGHDSEGYPSWLRILGII